MTERKKTQELLVQSEKMMAVGGLAAGMAHETNNPLGIILQANQNLGRNLERNRKTAEAVGDGTGLGMLVSYFIITLSGSKAGKV